MTYFLALIVGAWFCQCLIVAHHEAKYAGIAKIVYAVLCMLVSLCWPIMLGMGIRSWMLGKSKATRPSIDA